MPKNLGASGGASGGSSSTDVLPGDNHPPPLLILDIHLIQSVYPSQRGRDIVGGCNGEGGLDLLAPYPGRQAVEIDILAITGQTGDPVFFAFADITHDKDAQAFRKNREIGAGIGQDIVDGDPVGQKF